MENRANDIRGWLLNNIGGWLRVFQMLTFIGIIVLPVFCLHALYVGIDVAFESYSNLEIALSFVGALSVSIFSVLIFRKIRQKKPNTPQIINNLLGCMTLTGVIVSLVFFHLTDMHPRAILPDILYYFIWTRYFNKSKRVKTFYGSNAGRKVYEETTVTETSA